MKNTFYLYNSFRFMSIGFIVIFIVLFVVEALNIHFLLEFAIFALYLKYETEMAIFFSPWRTICRF